MSEEEVVESEPQAVVAPLDQDATPTSEHGYHRGLKSQEYINGDTIVVGKDDQVYTIPKDHEVVFTNSVVVQVINGDFYLAVGERNPFVPKHTRCETIVRMAPQFAKRLALLIAENVAEYEKASRASATKVRSK